jgi:hypothetical protein
MIVGGITLTIFLCSLKRDWDLKHYATTTSGEVYDRNGYGEMWYEYKVDGVTIRKLHETKLGEYYNRGDQIFVKYSMANPNIAIVVGQKKK